MANESEIAEDIQGQMAGAIKRYDTNDALNDEQIDAYAEKVAEMFAATVLSRCSQYQIDKLTDDK